MKKLLILFAVAALALVVSRNTATASIGAHGRWGGLVRVSYVEGRHLELVAHIGPSTGTFALIPANATIASQLEGAIGRNVAVVGDLAEVSIYLVPTIIAKGVQVY